ncbi:MAG: T9SS type A sorting domain-containing protein [Bacteroidales bacterium]
MKKLVTILTCIGIVPAAMHAQISLSPSVISAAGDYYEGTEMSISWTLGELAVTTLQGGNMILTQGFQQPFDIGVGIKQNKMNWNISVYPNPLGEELRIRFDVPSPGDYLIEIQDVTGRVMSQEMHMQVRTGETVILDTSGFLPGIYFLKVISPDKEQLQVTGLRKI